MWWLIDCDVRTLIQKWHILIWYVILIVILSLSHRTKSSNVGCLSFRPIILSRRIIIDEVIMEFVHCRMLLYYILKFDWTEFRWLLRESLRKKFLNLFLDIAVWFLTVKSESTRVSWLFICWHLLSRDWFLNLLWCMCVKCLLGVLEKLFSSLN